MTPGDVTMTSICAISCYDVIGIGAWHAVYTMLRQFFSDITAEILSSKTLNILKQITILVIVLFRIPA